MRPWRVVDPGGQLDVTLQPRYDKHTTLPGRDKGSETHQVFGTWSGRLRTDDGVEIEVDACRASPRKPARSGDLLRVRGRVS